MSRVLCLRNFRAVAVVELDEIGVLHPAAAAVHIAVIAQAIVGPVLALAVDGHPAIAVVGGVKGVARRRVVDRAQLQPAEIVFVEHVARVGRIETGALGHGLLRRPVERVICVGNLAPVPLAQGQPVAIGVI